MSVDCIHPLEERIAGFQCHTCHPYQLMCLCVRMSCGNGYGYVEEEFRASWDITEAIRRLLYHVPDNKHDHSFSERGEDWEISEPRYTVYHTESALRQAMDVVSYCNSELVGDYRPGSAVFTTTAKEMIEAIAQSDCEENAKKRKRVESESEEEEEEEDEEDEED